MKVTVCRDGSLDALVIEKMKRDVYHARQYIRDGDWVLDVGANIGAFSLFVKDWCRGAKIVCVEPMPCNVEALRINIAGSAEIEAAALSDHTGGLTIYDFGLANSGCHSMYDLDVVGAKPVKVIAITLQSIVEKYQIDHLRFLKLDCQGAEYDVIRAADPELLGLIDVVAMEVHHTIAAGDAVLGTIPNQPEMAEAMYARLNRTHTLAHGDLSMDDVEQVWVNRRGV